MLPPSLVELRRQVATLAMTKNNNIRRKPSCPRANASFSPLVPSANPNLPISASRNVPVPTPGAGRGAAAHDLAVARSLYARAHERRAVLCAAGADRRRDGRRHGQRGDRLQQSRLCQGRHRAVARRLADPCDLRRQGPRQDRSQDRADLDRGRRARHARHDRLHGPARYRQAAGGRDRRRRGGLRRGRLGGRPDRAGSRARARSASPAARTNATTSRRSSASTIASITAIPISRRS